MLLLPVGGARHRRWHTAAVRDEEAALRGLAWMLLSLLAVGGVACTGRGTAPDPALRVSAAASLTDAFTEVVAAFEAAHPGTGVALNLAGSTTLVEQLVRGAPVDVLATADTRTMQRALEQDVVTDPVVFARNTLHVAAPADGPPPDVARLADEELLVGLCAPEVPCGAAARDALAAAGVAPAPDTEDPDVRTLLARLVTGELDVGVVYATDVARAGDALRSVPLPGGATELAIATTRSAPPVAADFVAFVRSPAASAILREHGFEVVP